MQGLDLTGDFSPKAQPTETQVPRAQPTHLHSLNIKTLISIKKIKMSLFIEMQNQEQENRQSIFWHL